MIRPIPDSLCRFGKPLIFNAREDCCCGSHGMFPPLLGRPTDSLVAVNSACGFGGGVSRVLLDGRELPPSCALVVSSDLHEFQVQWLTCVQFFLMLSPYFHQKMIE